MPAPEEDKIDLERHFFQIRRPFLWSIFFATLAVIGDGPILVGEPLWYPGRVAQMAFLCAVIGGVFTEDRRLHASFSAAVLLVLVYISVTRFLIPG